MVCLQCKNCVINAYYIRYYDGVLYKSLYLFTFLSWSYCIDAKIVLYNAAVVRSIPAFLCSVEASCCISCPVLAGIMKSNHL